MTSLLTFCLLSPLPPLIMYVQGWRVYHHYSFRRDLFLDVCVAYVRIIFSHCLISEQLWFSRVPWITYKVQNVTTLRSWETHDYIIIIGLSHPTDGCYIHSWYKIKQLYWLTMNNSLLRKTLFNFVFENTSKSCKMSM